MGIIAAKVKRYAPDVANMILTSAPKNPTLQQSAKRPRAEGTDSDATSNEKPASSSAESAAPPPAVSTPVVAESAESSAAPAAASASVSSDPEQKKQDSEEAPDKAEKEPPAKRARVVVHKIFSAINRAKLADESNQPSSPNPSNTSPLSQDDTSSTTATIS